MKLGMVVGHTVLEWDPAPPAPKGALLSQFSAHVSCGQTAGWIKMPLGTEERPQSRQHCVRCGAQGDTFPNFWSMSIVAHTVTHLSYCCCWAIVIMCCLMQFWSRKGGSVVSAVCDCLLENGWETCEISLKGAPWCKDHSVPRFRSGLYFTQMHKWFMDAPCLHSAVLSFAVWLHWEALNCLLKAVCRLAKENEPFSAVSQTKASCVVQ